MHSKPLPSLEELVWFGIQEMRGLRELSERPVRIKMEMLWEIRKLVVLKGMDHVLVQRGSLGEESPRVWNKGKGKARELEEEVEEEDVTMSQKQIGIELEHKK